MWRFEGLKLASAFAAAAFVAGCATPQLPGPAQEGAARSSWLGRFSANWTDGSAPPRIEQASGRFTLADGGGRTELEIFSPFGQTIARAVSSDGGSVLETADGRRFEAANPEALTEAALGWRMPVQRLPAWLASRHPDRAIDAGWEVTVDARTDGLPSRLTLKWPFEHVPTTWRQVTIRLILDESRVEPTPR